jgi:hypothetical protein
VIGGAEQIETSLPTEQEDWALLGAKLDSIVQSLGHASVINPEFLCNILLVRVGIGCSKISNLLRHLWR